MENYSVKISIILPVYNSGPYLHTAVSSILNQTFKGLELILVDDGSTDGSSERCDEYARQDNRVVVIHQKIKGSVMLAMLHLRLPRENISGSPIMMMSLSRRLLRKHMLLRKYTMSIWLNSGTKP